MQDLLLYAGQDDNYQAAQRMMTKYLRVDADDSQIHRLCQRYGELLEKQSEDLAHISGTKAKELMQSVESDEVVYAMCDGCLLPTREEGGSWREMKLGRIFKQTDHYDLGEKANIIRQSIYVSHFGGHELFTNKFEQSVDYLEPLGDRLVTINDGAPWINNWISESYPKATNILDFYHAVEYLHDFAKIIWKKEGERAEWVNTQRLHLLNDGIKKVLSSITAIEVTGKVKLAAKAKLLTYYQNNQERMYYKTYRDRGLLIGSGPIEAAHRFVLQKRLKQSGQKWTRQGGQAVANLRVAQINGQWNKVVDLICVKNAA